MRRSVKFTFIIGVVCTLLAVSYYAFHKSLRPLWSTSSSFENLHEPLMGIIDISLLEDYFRYDHFGKTISYKVTPLLKLNDFQNAEQELMGLNSVDQTLKKVLNINNQEKENLINLLHKNLIEDFNRNLLTEFEDKKIYQGSIEWKIEFEPKQVLNINYKEELNKDGTLVWVPNKDLSQDLYSEEKTLFEKVKALPVPYTNQTFQYLAGEIIYHLKWDQSKRQNPFETYAEGEVHYVKYYRVNTSKPFEATSRSAGFQLEHIRFRKKEDVSIIKVVAKSNFNSVQLIPELRRLDIEFDQLDEFILTGKLSTSEKDYSFETFIPNLVFFIENNELTSIDEEKTVIRTDLLPRGVEPPGASLFKNQISTKILREHSSQIMNAFSNREFSSQLKVKRGQ